MGNRTLGIPGGAWYRTGTQRGGDLRPETGDSRPQTAETAHHYTEQTEPAEQTKQGAEHAQANR
jgi:hypothetical protein